MGDEVSTLVVCARVKPECAADFAHWHQAWQSAVLGAPGALSFEYFPPVPPDRQEAVALARFTGGEALAAWRRSDRNRELIAQAEPLAAGGIVMQLAGEAAAAYQVERGATLVVITEIKPGREAEYRVWADEMQKVQEGFAGYVGSFVSPPQHNESGWTTVLRFDSVAHLDAWVKSPQRTAMLRKAEDLIVGFRAQRVATSFPGWVPNDPATGKPPSAWKTAGLVLLGLFPIVMLELRFLNPVLRAWNFPPALGTFTGNAISVALTTWPLMPLLIRAFHAWLFPERQPRWLVLTSPWILLLCYVIEIAVLWRLL